MKKPILAIVASAALIFSGSALAASEYKLAINNQVNSDLQIAHVHFNNEAQVGPNLFLRKKTTEIKFVDQGGTNGTAELHIVKDGDADSFCDFKLKRVGKGKLAYYNVDVTGQKLHCNLEKNHNDIGQLTVQE